LRDHKLQIEVRLHFSEEQGQLLMHDYDDHKKVVILSDNIKANRLSDSLTGNARRLCLNALRTQSPATHLNIEFLLNGYFRF
jgi:hypothetical protein